MVFVDRICGHKEPNVPLDAKPFGFPFDRKIDFDIHKVHEKTKTLRQALFFGITLHQSNRSVANALVHIIFLAGITPDKMIGSPVFTTTTTTTTTEAVTPVAPRA